MKVLVTGANGQLGAEVVKLLKQKEIHVIPTKKEDMNITEQESVFQTINDVQPNVIIHCAAYTNVDKAETDVDNAFNVNANGTCNIAIAAERVDAKLCYISTDYVFDGESTFPYDELSKTNPTGVYGKSKLAGEELVKSLSSKFFIVRTSWVFGSFGNNFVKTMLQLADQKDEIGVVVDQVGSPTYTVDLADFLLELVKTEKYGIYHASNSGSCSWHDFACAIFEEAEKRVKVNKLTSEEFPRPAKRPKNSVLGHLAIQTNGFPEFRNWRNALQDYLQEIGVK